MQQRVSATLNTSGNLPAMGKRAVSKDEGVGCARKNQTIAEHPKVTKNVGSSSTKHTAANSFGQLNVAPLVRNYYLSHRILNNSLGEKDLGTGYY